MECAEYSLDELLCQSLLLFRQYRLYDDPDCFVNASRMLEEVRRLIDNTQSGVDMAKWGCVVECLAQKFYISSDTDTMLGEFDVALAAYWKRIEKSPLESVTVPTLVPFSNMVTQGRGSLLESTIFPFTTLD